MNGIHEVTGSIPVWSTILRSPVIVRELRLASHAPGLPRRLGLKPRRAIHRARRRLSAVAAEPRRRTGAVARSQVCTEFLLGAHAA